MRDSLQSFIQCLCNADEVLSTGVGLGCGIEEIVDMLWLARHIKGSTRDEFEKVDEDVQIKSNQEDSEEADKGKVLSYGSDDLKKESSNKLVTHVDGSAQPSLQPLMIPAAAALRQPLRLAQSLRTLARKTESRTQEVIDEEATAIAIAEDNQIRAIKRPAQERWLDLDLIVEHSKISALWDRTSKEFIELSGRLGAFRTIRIWTLETYADEKGNLSPVLTAGLRTSHGEKSRNRKHKELLDSSGRRLIMLLSDCISPLWRHGIIHNWLADWANNRSTVIIQWFPSSYWARTGLKSGDEVWLSALRPGIANNCLVRQYVDVAPEEWIGLDEDVYSSRSFVVPVVSLEPASLGNWSHVVAGFGNTQVQGRRFELSWDGTRWWGPIKRPRQLPGSGEERVELFLETASEMAKELARLLALGPVSPEVTNLIQETLLPQSGVVHVAEVFLSGLLETTASGAYQFAPGVQELLQRSTNKTDEKLVFQVLSEYIRNRYRRTPREFKAFLQNHSNWSEEQWSKVEGFAELKQGIEDSTAGCDEILKEYSQKILKSSISLEKGSVVSERSSNTHEALDVLLALIVSASVRTLKPSELVKPMVAGVFGSRANAVFSLVYQYLVERLPRKESEPVRIELRRLLHLSYLRALVSVSSLCKAELVGSFPRIYRGQPIYNKSVKADMRWLDSNLRRLEQQIKTVESQNTPPDNGLGDLPIFSVSDKSTLGVALAYQRILEQAIEPDAISLYVGKLQQPKEGVLDKTFEFFIEQLAKNPKLQLFFETQLLVQIHASLAEQKATLQDIDSNLKKVSQEVSQAVPQKIEQVIDKLEAIETDERPDIIIGIIQDVRALLLGTQRGSVEQTDTVSSTVSDANPFVPTGGRIDSTDKFFGHEQTLRKIFETLNSRSSVALIGDREMGKSSLLKAVEASARDNLTVPRQPVYLDLRNVADEDDFYYALCEKVGIPESKGYRLRRELQSKKILLILDEIEKMAWDGFTNQVRGQLRSLSEGKEAPLRLVIAASEPLDQLFIDSTDSNQVSPLSGICHEIHIADWSEDIIRDFITDRLQLTSIDFSEADVLEVIQASQGKPREVMKLCHERYAILQERQS